MMQSTQSSLNSKSTLQIQEEIFDFIVVGSGFGGSVTAMRLSQKGYKVAVIEKGLRFENKDYPHTNWNLKKFLWAPFLKCFGIQQISLLKGVMVLHGSGVGGGSLVYANTLMQPQPKVLSSSAWPESVIWRERFEKNFIVAKKMLGVQKNLLPAAADTELLKLATAMKSETSYHLTDVGVYFNEKDKTPVDPYFSGAGPIREPCVGCGGCMVGCRFNSKNTLDKNYLYFAENWGTQIFPGLAVQKIDLKNGLYSLTTSRSQSWFGEGPAFRAHRVVLSAGVLGTLGLLFRNKNYHKSLVNISPHLGDQVRTNGESLCGASTLDKSKNYSNGVAIGSAFHIGSDIKIEPVRYSIGSNAMKLLAVPLVNLGNFFQANSLNHLWRVGKLFFAGILRSIDFVKIHWFGDWAKQTIILLVMQSSDEKMKLKWGRSLFNFFKLGLVRDPLIKNNIPSYIPVAQEASQLLAQQINGTPQNIFSEVIFNTPATAHILGGVPFGKDARSGVIDENFEVFNYPGLYVCDGSVIPVNLGVNPSLTITSLAETFCEQFSAKEGVEVNLLTERQILFSKST